MYASRQNKRCLFLSDKLLGSLVHWGIDETKFAENMLRISHNRFSAVLAGVLILYFYIQKYSIATFVAATGASFVIAWSILKPKEARQITSGVVVLIVIVLLTFLAASYNV